MKNTKSFLEGPINKAVIIFMIPVLLANFCQLFYSMTDAIICGYFLEADEVAGLNNSSCIIVIVLNFINGCASGFSVETAKMVGKRDDEKIRITLSISICLIIIVGVILIIISIAFLPFVLKLLGLSEGSNYVIYTSAKKYLTVLFTGLVFMTIYNLLICFFRSIGNSMLPLIFLILSTSLNILLDLIFIILLNFSVVGVAIATIISQCLCAIFLFYYLYKKNHIYFPKISDLKYLNYKVAIRYLKQGIPLGFQFSLLGIGLLIVQSSIIKFDILDNGIISNECQIGFGAANKLHSFLMTPLTALGITMLSFCGQNYGAANYDRIKKGLKNSFFILMIMCLIIIPIGYIFTINGFYQKIFLSDEKINALTLKYGRLFLWTVLPFYPLVGLLYILRNSMQGLGKPLFPFLAGLGELIGRSFVCFIFPPLVNKGNITRDASDLSFIVTCLAEPMCWLFALIPLIIGIKLNIFNKKRGSYELY